MTILRSLLPAAVGLAFAAVFALPAQAGVATAGAVLLDPFDPVPEIQFHHFGGYGCSDGCGSACDYGCGARYDGCHDGCGRRYYHRRHHDCDDGCRRVVRDDCNDDCRHHGHDGDRDGHGDRDGDDRRDADDDRDGPPPAPPCVSGHCYDAQHWERRWRDGDHVGQQWEDRGTRERTLSNGGHADGFYGHDYDWRVDDDPPPPPPPPPPEDDHHHHH